MIDTLILILLFVNSFLPGLIGAIAIAKVFLFIMNKKQTWKAYNIIYFENRHLVLSHSNKSYNNKKIQNKLTEVLAGLTIWYQAVLFISGFLNLHSFSF